MFAINIHLAKGC